MNLKDKNILLMGLGISNVSVAKWLADKKLKALYIRDEKPKEEFLDKVGYLPPGNLVLAFEDNPIKDFSSIDLVIRQPSIPLSHPELKLTEQSKTPIETDISLFFKLCPSKKIIGVTGSKGKTTTATFLYELLKAHGHKAILGGNMGIPVFDILEEVDEDTWVVLEISSYMAESLARHKLAPKYVIFTSLFNEHQDHYKDFDEYVKAKTEWLQYMPEDGWLYHTGDLYTLPASFLNSISADIDDPSVYPEGGLMIKDFFSGDLKYKGEHYIVNLVMGLIFVNKFLKLDIPVARKVVENFKIEHRMEYLGEKDGREFINNSMAVNPTTFCMDLDVVLEANKPIFMIVGGGDKNLDIMKIADKINNTDQIIKVAIHAGSHKGRTPKRFIHNLLTNKVVGIYEELKDCFQYLYDESKEGSIIFFNPGFTGFIRGKEFKKCVNSLV